MDSGSLLSLIIMFLLLVGIVFLALRLKSVQKQKQQTEEKFVALQHRIDDLQLENLESRLNPHLFKNILNSIQSHAYKTYFALDKMAGVLDYILYESRNKYVSVKDEIAFALNLIEINKIKMSPLFDLSVKTRIDENDPLYEQALLAPLLTTDFIENAFKHADLQHAGSFISILIEYGSGHFSLTVSNKISERQSLQKQHSGIGIAALDKRLKILYGERFKREFFVENGTYIAHLKLDLRGYKTPMHTS